MTKILITGGLGFVGSNLADRSLSEGNEVAVFDNMSRKGTENNLKWLQQRHPGVTFIKGDVRRIEEIKDASKDADVIYHTAGQVAVTTSVKSPKEDFDINAMGALNALEAARLSGKNPVFIFTSTNKVYGQMENLGVKEDGKRYTFSNLPSGVSESTPLDFHSPYGCSKGSADQYVRDYSRIYGLNSVVFRMSCIYGTRQFGNEDQGWVAHFIISSILGKPVTIYGDGKQIRDVLYIDDLVSAFALATKNINKSKGNVYNIGGGPKNTLSLLELIDILKKLNGKAYEYPFGEWRPGDQKVFFCDISKAKEDFGWEPKISPDEGVAKLHKWVLDNRDLFEKFM
jgi:CDP-paratose 2-epimerase